MLLELVLLVTLIQPPPFCRLSTSYPVAPLAAGHSNLIDVEPEIVAVAELGLKGLSVVSPEVLYPLLPELLFALTLNR